MIEWIISVVGGTFFMWCLKWCWNIGKLIIHFKTSTPKQRLFLKLVLHAAIQNFLAELIEGNALKRETVVKIIEWERQRREQLDREEERLGGFESLSNPDH